MYKQRQLTNSIIMVRPHDFGFNEQTGTDNEFQHRPASVEETRAISTKAMAEFENMVNILSKEGLEVMTLDKPDRDTSVPDAIFPNNWFSTRADGHLFIYPMKTANRQAEVQVPELKSLVELNQYSITQVIDLRDSAKAMEGTGSLIFHHPASTIYAAISERCDRQQLETYANNYGYEAFAFSSQSQTGSPIYHTNVLMSCGERFAVIVESILTKDAEKEAALSRLHDYMDDVVYISEQQMTEHFCGNILQLADNQNQPVIVMSESAFNGFTKQQLSTLEKHGRIIACPIPTIEYVGGGSARCMIAENFLPK